MINRKTMTRAKHWGKISKYYCHFRKKEPKKNVIVTFLQNVNKKSLQHFTEQQLFIIFVCFMPFHVIICNAMQSRQTLKRL